MITSEQVWGEIGVKVPAEGTQDAANMDAIVDAVNVLVPKTVPQVRELTGEEWPSDVTRGAVMQASRLFARRNSPTGVAAYTDAGPSYVARWDPDLERLFQIGSWVKPKLG